MKNFQITSEITVYDDKSELPQDLQLLMDQAVAARKNAYAPYSRFRVGAAIALDNGDTVIGSNQENAAYPSGLCAERVAIFHASALHPDSVIRQIAISAAADHGTTEAPIPPCGSCRQVIAEYEIKQEAAIEIFFMGETGPIYKTQSVKHLLPLMFDKNYL